MRRGQSVSAFLKSLLRGRDSCYVLIIPGPANLANTHLTRQPSTYQQLPFPLESHPNVGLWPVRRYVVWLLSKPPVHSSPGHTLSDPRPFSVLRTGFFLAPALCTCCSLHLEPPPSPPPSGLRSRSPPPGGCPRLHPLKILPPLSSPCLLYSELLLPSEILNLYWLIFN